MEEARTEETTDGPECAECTERTECAECAANGRGLGLVHVYTGDGKGKTTAALGMAFRAAGWGLKTLFIQFIKGGFRYGELASAEGMGKLIEIRPLGRGFIKDCTSPADCPEDRAAAEDALGIAQGELAVGDHALVVLDEVLYALKLELIDPARVAEAVRARAKGVEVVMTGRGPVPDELLDLADYVTEMKAHKHPYDSGIKARKGVEF